MAAKKAEEEKSAEFAAKFTTGVECPTADMEHCLLSGPVQRVFLIRDFISSHEHDLLVQAITENTKFRTVVGRQVAVLGGFPVLGTAMNKLRLPFWLDPILKRLETHGVFEQHEIPNHCLMNLYEPGCGLRPHQDGPLYTPRVAILSLESSCVFEFCPKDSEACIASVFVPRRSLLVFDRDAYLEVRHSVPFRRVDCIESHCINMDPFNVRLGDQIERGRRISLTMRFVKDVNEHFDETLLNDLERQELRVREAAFLRSISEK
jgi:alkylated DNA repair protein alkB homolog 6